MSTSLQINSWGDADHPQADRPRQLRVRRGDRRSGNGGVAREVFTTQEWVVVGWRYQQISKGSFSAVSKPKFASKYSLESSWRDLQDLHAFAPLSIQNFSQISSIFFRMFTDLFWKVHCFQKVV